MNYYEILELPKSASKSQIKASYKKLVKQYHPDLYRGDKDFAEKKIKEINEAYDVLSNPEKKIEYDNYLNELSSTQNYAYQSPQYNTQNSSQDNSSANSSKMPSLSKFILDHFEKLNSKTQLQIFIMIVVFILAIFLVNLIQAKQYLSETTSDSRNTQNTHSQDIQTQNVTVPSEDNIQTVPDKKFESIDEMFNEIIRQYTEEYYNNYQ